MKKYEKEIRKIKAEIARRQEQIANINRLLTTFEYEFDKCINEYEKNYMRITAGQLRKYRNWLEDELRYLDEDLILAL